MIAALDQICEIFHTFSAAIINIRQIREDKPHQPRYNRWAFPTAAKTNLLLPKTY